MVQHANDRALGTPPGTPSPDEASDPAVRDGWDALLALALNDAHLGTWRWRLTDDSVEVAGHLAQSPGRRERWAAGTGRSRFIARLHADDRERVARGLDIVLGGTASEYGETFRVVGGGRVAHVSARARILRDPAARPLAMVGVTSDVTAHLSLDAERRRAEATIEAVLDAAPLAVIGMDASFRVTRWNRAAARVFGYAAAEVLGRVNPLLADADAERQLRDALAACVRDGEAAGVHESVRRAKDGTSVDVLVSPGVLRSTDGAVAEFVVVLTDVRERNRLETQLRQAQKMEAVGQLAGGVAHDFNNLLTIIRGAADYLMADLPPGGTAYDDAREIRAAADRAARLTRQLLAFSRKQVLAPRPLDLHHALRTIEPMLRRLIGADVELVTLGEGEPLGVLADPGQLEQVVLNLAVNARDAMPEGGVLILDARDRHVDAAEGARLTVPVPPGRYATLEVTDTGVGMNAETVARLFEPFFTTKDVGRGTGLGLATVYGIVTQSGGGVDVRTTPGRGTTFCVHLPWVALGTAPATPATVPPAVRASRPPKRAEEPGTVLVVEDEAAVRTTVRRVLERRGYHVLEARHGADALALLRARPAGAAVDLVLSDVTMPEMGGRALWERVAAEWPGIPVLLMSGYVDEHLATGAGEVLAKPFTADVLAARVAQAIAGATRGGATAA